MPAFARNGSKAALEQSIKMNASELVFTTDSKELFFINASGTTDPASRIKVNLTINDEAISAEDVWSSEKVKTYIDAKLSAGSGETAIPDHVHEGADIISAVAQALAVPGSGVTQSPDYRLVNDTQIAVWDAKVGLDANGKIPLGALPDVSKQATYVVHDAAERLALIGLVSGAKAYETTTGDSYIWDGTQWLLQADADWANVNIQWSNVDGKPSSLADFGINGVVESPVSGMRMSVQATRPAAPVAGKEFWFDTDIKVPKTFDGGQVTWQEQAAVLIRANSARYELNQYLILDGTVSNGHIYQCVFAGAAAATQPAYPTDSAAVVTDGTAVFKEVGAISVWENNKDYLAGALVVPTTQNGHFYKATVAGKTDLFARKEPAWPVAAAGLVDDGGWTYHFPTYMP